MTKRRGARLLLAPIALSAFVATWGGWVGLAEKTGFGEVNLLPGFVKRGEWATVNLGISLPLGVEAYAAYAMSIWFGTGYTRKAKRFAALSAVFSLLLAAAGQVSFHVLEAKQIEHAPDWLVGFVSCLPVLVIGMAAALHHLTRERVEETTETSQPGTWGRLWDAAGTLAETRLRQAAETHRDVSAETRPAPLPAPAEPVAETVTVPELPSGDVPETPVSEPEGDVPAAQPVAKLSRDEMLVKVHEWRTQTPPLVYSEIAKRLGVSRAEAGRLGKEAETRFGTTSETTLVLEEAARQVKRNAETMNGHRVLAGKD